jgi:hypothetical protein
LPALNDTITSLEEKIDWVATNYIEMLLKNPDLPIFVLSEVRSNPERFGKAMQLKSQVMRSVFLKQLAERKPGVNPIHFFLNFLGMMVFPFIAKPVFGASGAVSEGTFVQMIAERKALIPQWMKLMLE